jgi:uncharacterized membrane protein YheB (UPF0754 family)
MDWEQIRVILGYISGPVIGAIIGLFTNYIAVKMLFHPLHPIKIGKFKVPFTPGIIPKRRGALASAIGHAVGEELFTPDDLAKMLCSDEVEKKLVSTVTDTLTSLSSRSIDDISSSICDDDTAQSFKDKMSLVLAEKFISATKNMDLGGIISTLGKDAINEKKASLGMLGMFLTDAVVDPLLCEVKEKVDSFIDEKGVETSLGAIQGEVLAITSVPIGEQFDFSKIDADKLSSAIIKLYESAVLKTIDSAMGSINIVSIVEKKVNDMDIRDLEALCLRVMKKELNDVIYLGGVIGFVIGIVNIFI